MNRFLAAAALLMLGFSLQVRAQQVTTSVPFQSIGSSYYENNSIGWSLRGPNWFANFGGGVVPPFGPFDPNSGLSGGFARSFGGGVSGNLNFNFAQGSNRSISSTTPSLTTMNGVPGSITVAEIRPFVIGVTPVVGDYPTIVDPGQISAQIGQQQLSSLYQANAQVKSKKLMEYLRRGERAEAAGNKRMARANYRSAMALAAQPLRSQIQLRMNAMLKRKSPPADDDK